MNNGEPEYKNTQVKVDRDTWTALKEKAAAAGISPDELLKQLVEEFDPDNEPPAREEETPLSEAREAKAQGETVEETVPITPEQLNAWVEDLQLLLVERYGFANSS